MNNNDSIFRSVGSTGLVIFERDGTLLRRGRLPRDFMLGDISNEFVQMLQQLRKIDVRFGFISDARGMDVGSYGRSEFAVLTGRLDELLRVREAMPDFWMAWDIFPQESGTVVQAGEERRRSDGAGMILRAIEWYGVEKKEVIFVNSTTVGLLAANDADISAIQYPSASETVSTQRLHAEIQRILGLSRRHTERVGDSGHPLSDRGPDLYSGAGEA